MSTIVKKIIPLFLCVFLLSCGGTVKPEITVTPDPKPVLQIPEKDIPLKLAPVEWRVVVLDGKAYYMLDTKNYSNLSKNMENIQSKLNVYKQSLDKQSQYYSK